MEPNLVDDACQHLAGMGQVLVEMMNCTLFQHH